MKKFFVISALIFAVFFVILSVFAGANGTFFNTNDYFFHLYKSNDSCFTEHYKLETCENYAPMFSLLASPFAQNESTFILFVLAILIFLIPGLIYLKTKSKWTLLIYYSSSFLFNILYASIFAQMVLTILVILMLFSEKTNPFKDGFILLLGYFTHSHAIYVLLPILFYKHLSALTFNKENFAPYVFLSAKTFSISEFFKLGPLINWFYSFYLTPPQILLIAYLILTGIFVDYRTVLFIPILWAFWLPGIINKRQLNKKTRFLLFLNYFLWFIFQCVIWFKDIWLLGQYL